MRHLEWDDPTHPSRPRMLGGMTRTRPPSSSPAAGHRGAGLPSPSGLRDLCSLAIDGDAVALRRLLRLRRADPVVVDGICGLSAGDAACLGLLLDASGDASPSDPAERGLWQAWFETGWRSLVSGGRPPGRLLAALAWGRGRRARATQAA